MHKESKKIEKHSDHDKTGGIWEIDVEDNSIRRKKMIANVINGNAPVPYEVGDTVLFNTIDSVAEGTVTEIKESSYIIQAGSKKIEILHDQVFDKPEGHLF